MLNPEDRDAIDGLFERIDKVARSAGPRDQEAETLIGRHLREAPAAPYYMAQTLLMQEHALRVAEQRISELEDQVQRGQAPARREARGPWGQRDDYGDERYDGRRGGGGGFLAGAAQTALGVTGGVLLGSAIAGMLTGGAQAEEYQPDEPADEPVDDTDAGMDDGGDFDMGGDF